MSRRDYEMAFQLSANIDAGFNSKFKLAQDQVNKLQDKIIELNKEQANITAYEHQQKAIEQTKDKLELLEKQYENIQKEYVMTGMQSSDLQNKMLAKQAQIDKTKESLESYQTKLEATGKKIKEAGYDTDDLTGSTKKLEAQIEKTKEAQRKMADAGAQSLQAAVSAFEASGVTASLKELAEEYMLCVKAAGVFSETMSTVEALSGATGSQMSELAETAKRLGAETKFTAQQSAEAYTYMAMAGWDAGDMISGIDGLMNLAAASGEDLAQVSDIVTDNLTAFGMKAEDTAHFADVLAAAATNSNTSVGVMGETFRQSAALAGTLGYSAEDVAVAVGLMANAGIKGSAAGTALKNTFIGLSQGVTLSGEAIGEYEFSATKADGTMKTFSETIEELRVVYSKLSKTEQLANAEMISGKYGMTGLSAILNATTEDYNSLSESINHCSGSASKMAEIKMDNMNGQLALAKSAWEGVTIAIGEEFEPVMTEAYKLAAEVFGILKEFVEKNPALVKAVITFTTAMLGLVAAYKALDAIKALNIVSMFGNPWILAAAGVATLVTGIASLVSEAENGEYSMAKLTEQARELEQALGEADNALQNTQVETQATAEAASYYVDRLKEIEEETKGNVEGNTEYHNILALLTREIPELADLIDLETDSINGGTEALYAHIDAWKEDAEQKAYQEYMNALYDEYSDVLKESAENSIKLTAAQLRQTKAEESRENALERQKEIYAEIVKEAENMQKETGMPVSVSDLLAMNEEYSALEAEIERCGQEIADSEKEQKKLKEYIEKDAEALKKAQGAVDEYNEVMEEKKRIEDEAFATTRKLQAEEAALKGRIDETVGSVQTLVDSYYEAYDAALESFRSQFGLFDEAEADMNATVDAAKKALDSQLQYWEQYSANIEGLKGISAEDLGVTQENYEALMSYVRDGGKEAAGLAASMVEKINNGDTEAVAELANTIGEIQRQQKDVADETADWQTDFEKKMAELAEKLADDIEAMDLSNEAAASGAATIQGYINGIESKNREVQDAIAKMVGSINAALPGYAEVYARNGNIGRVGYGYKHAASGTESALPGIYEVGENGPEWVMFNGGEKVLNAAQTAKAKDAILEPAFSGRSGISDAGGINYSPVINFNGTSASKEEVAAVMEDSQERFKQMMEEYLHEVGRLSFV